MTSQQRFTHITRPEGVAPGPGYSHVVTGTGRLVAVGGRLFVVPAAGHSVQNRTAGNPAQATVEHFLGGG